MAPQSFAQLVSLACHDLRTPLATAAGFARTLQRIDEIGPPADRYVEMIGAASDQIATLLDLLSVVARVESDRFEPRLHTTNSRELADAAAARAGSDATVQGDGVEVTSDVNWGAVSIAAIAEAARRHGGLQRITMTVDGPVISISPIVDSAGPIATGDDLRDFAAAVGTRVLHATGASVALAAERLEVRFPTA